MTFQSQEAKLFDERFPNIDGIGGSHGIWIKSVFTPYSLEVKSFLHESHKRYAEWLVGLLEEQISQANIIQSPRLDDTIMGLDSAISIIKSSLN